VVIAVIDTGVDMTHPDLTANMWTNPSDGTHGYDYVNNDNDPTDDQGHGTCCAGLTAAIQDNSIGITGVAPHCRTMAMKAATMGGGYTTTFAGTSGSCPQVAGVAALCFSVLPGASPETVRDAIEDTATLQNQSPYGEFTNYGLVDAQAAVLRMLGGSAPTKAA